MTPNQCQIARRMHHQAELLGPGEHLSVRVGDLRSVLAALWFEVDRANAAEDRLAKRTGQARRLLAPLRVFAPTEGASGGAPETVSAGSAN